MYSEDALRGSVDDLPRGLTDNELDHALKQRAALRWADAVRAAVYGDEPEPGP